MSTFNYAILSLLLTVPKLGMSSPLSLTSTSDGLGPTSIMSYSTLNSAQAIVTTLSAGSQFLDDFKLTIGTGYTGTICFINSTNTGGINILLFNVYELLAGSLQQLPGSNNPAIPYLSSGSHEFLVTGITTGNIGLYSVAASVTSAVPLPAAIWLFGTA